MSDSSNTDSVNIETVLEAAGIPQHASVYNIDWNDGGDVEIEWAVDE